MTILIMIKNITISHAYIMKIYKLSPDFLIKEDNVYIFRVILSELHKNYLFIFLAIKPN